MVDLDKFMQEIGYVPKDSERNQTPPTSNERLYGAKDRVEEIKRTIEDMRRHELRGLIPQDEALFLIGEIERLTRERNEARQMAEPLRRAHENISHLRSALEKLLSGPPTYRPFGYGGGEWVQDVCREALSGEPDSAHETSDELEQLRHVYQAAWAYKNAKPGEETIEAYANLDDALWDRKRAESAEKADEEGSDEHR